MQQLPDRRPATSDSLKARPVEATPNVQRALTARNLGDPDSPPFEASENARGEISAAIRAHEERLLPSSKTWLLERVTKLLNHYWANANDDRQRESILDDWVHDLQEYPAWAINETFNEWRHGNEYAPKISQILKILRAKLETDIRRRDHLQAVLDVAVDISTEAPRQRRRRPDRLDGCHSPRPDSPFFYARPDNIPPDSDREAVKIWAANLVKEVSESLTGSFAGGVMDSLNSAANAKK